MLNNNELRQDTGVVDRDGRKVFEGDTIILPYIDPTGKPHYDADDGRFLVEFKHGSFGIQTETMFNPLLDFMKTSNGDYISNHGNKVIYGDSIFKVISGLGDSDA
jgi:hypothetical protein